MSDSSSKGDLTPLLQQHERALERMQRLVERHQEVLERLDARAGAAERQPLLDRIAELERDLARLRRKALELDKIRTYRWYPLMTRYGVLKEKIRRLLGGSPRRRPAVSAEPAIASPPGARPAAGTPLAGAPPEGRVCIVAPLFFDVEGAEIYLGGAERYAVELARLVRAMGYAVEIYQSGRGDWARYHQGFPVIGLETGGDIGELNAAFHGRVRPPALTIYLAFNLAQPACFQPSIGISHGVFWDTQGHQRGEAERQAHIAQIVHAVTNLSAAVSVDTNTINWLRTVDRQAAEKFHYVPNFVDLAEFRPASGAARDAGQVVILFPRRFYEARGYWLMAEVVPDILARYPQAVFSFVGQADSEREARHMTRLIEEHGGRVRWRTLAPEQMPAAYREADITVIPTVSSEGTSLSCLEAMASGNAVIASDVGGLPNLVLPRHNGLLIRPRADELRRALEELIEDAALRRRLAANAVETARVFDLAGWQVSWRRRLADYLPERPAAEVRRARRPPRVVVIENARIPWDHMKQRPQFLAEELARAGWQTFWRESGEPPRPGLANLHMLWRREGEVPIDAPHPFLYIFYPYDYERIRLYKDPVVIYDLLDDISIYAETDERHGVPPGKRGPDYQRRMLERADIVMTSARTLYDKIAGVRPDTLLVPNGVDPEMFDARRMAALAAPDDIARIAGPRIGFHGAIAEWVDVELLERLLRACPDYQFVFIGPITNEGFRDVMRLGNCHYLGVKTTEMVPRYVAAMDVGLVPFLINETTRGMRALKVVEYLAMRKPVASAPLPESSGWPYVFVGRGAAEMRRAIERALAARSTVKEDAELTAFVEANTWRRLARPLIRRMHRVWLEKNASARHPSNSRFEI